MLLFNKFILIGSNFYYLRLVSLILFLFILKKACLLAINGKYPIAKLLPDGNIFILNDMGISIYNNYDFTLNKSIYNFSDCKEKINENNYKKIAVSEYEGNDNYYILFLINRETLYIFESKSYNLSKKYLDLVGHTEYYNLIPFKLENESVLHYTINFIYKENETYYINFYHYKINLSQDNSKNILISKEEYYDSINCSDFIEKNLIINYFLSSQITLSENHILTCFFLEYNGCEGNLKEIIVDKYNIENNYTFLYTNELNVLSDFFFDLQSSLPNKERKCLFCYIKENHKSSCLIYDIEKNEFNSSIIYEEYCEKLNIYYFKECNQYIVICKILNMQEIQFKFLILNDNFIMPNICSHNEIIVNISSCKEVKGFSLIYNSNKEQYGLIYDCYDNNGDWFISYNISIFKSNYCKHYSDLSNFSDIQTIYTTFENDLITQYPSININISTITINDTLSDSIINSDDYIDSLNNFSFYLENDILKLETNIKKGDLENNLDKIINKIEIGKLYEIKGKDFDIFIRPTNSTYLENTTHIDFNNCEEFLRNVNNISSSRIITFLQIEINDNNKQSLVNKVEYQVYDDNKTILDLSVCNNTQIQIFYSLKNNSIDIKNVEYFKGLRIDIFNIKDSFFNDICRPYSNKKNDIILKDRIRDIFKNYSLCNERCEYNGINIESKTSSCICEVKNNITFNDSSLQLSLLDQIEIESNFKIIKCYKLVFSLDEKLNNIGFLIFLVLILTYIPFLTNTIIKGIKPIKEYILNEMIKNGYIQEQKTENNNIKDLKINKINPPKKKKKKLKICNPKNIAENSSLNNYKTLKNTKIEKDSSNNYNPLIDSIIKEDISKSCKELKIKSPKVRKIKTKKKYLDSNDKESQIQKNIDILPTQGNKKNNKENNKEEKNNIINFNLINIDLNVNNNKSYTPKESYIFLNNYTYEEAIKYDMRSICSIFYIFLLSKQAVFHAFLYKSPLELFSLRLCHLIFIISSDLALNSLFFLMIKFLKNINMFKIYFCLHLIII